MPPPVELPPALYLPCIGTGTGGPDDVETQRLKAGGRGLVAYTALDRLLAACGGDQPWTLVTTSTLEELVDVLEVDEIFLDLAKPEELRKGPAVTDLPVPPVLFVPCLAAGLPEERTDALLVEHDGVRDLPAYSALDRLRGALGEAQPWYLADTGKLLAHQEAMGFDRLVVDQPVTFTGIGDARTTGDDGRSGRADGE